MTPVVNQLGAHGLGSICQLNLDDTKRLMLKTDGDVLDVESDGDVLDVGSDGDVVESDGDVLDVETDGDVGVANVVAFILG